jgi:type IV pilus assembly protein PilM
VVSLFKSSGSKTLLGIELNPERITVAQVKKQGSRSRLTHYHSVEMPEGAMIEGRILDPPTIGLALSNLLSENRIPLAPVATAVPVREAIVRLIRLPAELPADELRRVVLEQEAELYIPYPRDQADVDFQPLGLDVSADGIERVEVLLVAIPREVVDNYMEVLKAANLKVRCVELTSFSLIRTIRDQLAQFGAQEAVVLTSIGFESTEISILVNGIPQFTRTVNIGTTHMQQVLAQALNLPATRTGDLLASLKLPVTSPTESLGMGEKVSSNPGVAAVSRVLTDLGDELRRSMDFYINQERSCPVVKVLLAGSGAGLNQIDSFLAQRLSVPVELADPLRSLNVPDTLDVPLNERPSMGVALGLGLREFTG